MLNRKPGGSAFCWVLAFSTTSCLQRVSKIPSGPQEPLRLSVAFPTTLVSDFSDPQLSDFLSWPSYIIVQRPLNRPLNLCNGMFDRHQAEITVMQFTGHSLPVHQSMSVSWAFTLSHFISQIRQRRFLSITGYWNVSLRSSASLWNGMFGRVAQRCKDNVLIRRSDNERVLFCLNSN